VAFIGLEMVTLVKNFSNQPVSWRRTQRFVGRQERRFSWTHISKDESAHFLARIGRMANFVSKVPARSLTGLIQAISMNVIEPAVIKTTESTGLDSAGAPRGPGV